MAHRDSNALPPRARAGATQAALFAAALFAVYAAPTLAAQQDPATVERLRRDQDEILRKAERLQKLMTRLKVRYEREGKDEQVAYLTEGLAHLERSGVLRDVATIRENIESTAFTEALRKQNEVVEDLERLLNILLARKSVESLDEQIEEVREQARTASQLEQRQRELIDQAQQAMERALSPADPEPAPRSDSQTTSPAARRFREEA